MLDRTVWPCYSSGLLHGFGRVNFVDGFGGGLCLDVLWGVFFFGVKEMGYKLKNTNLD